MPVTEFSSKLVITSSDDIYLVDTNSGDSQTTKVPVPEVPPNPSKGQLQVLNKRRRTINCVAISKDERHVAVATENKQIVIFDTSLNVTKNFITNRAASKLLWTSNGDVLVADRTGDVYRYENGKEKEPPVLLLGHLSMILDMALSECEKYIVTCDRDEKIRVSHYPHTYDIVSFCLGHAEFVTRVKVIAGLLLSASGDGTVRIWDYVKGQELGVIDTNEHIRDEFALENFVGRMDRENVEVGALPITDMQVCCKNNNSLLVAVSIYNYKSIQLYTVDLSGYQWHVEEFSIRDESYNLHLNPTRLYIFYASSLTLHALESQRDVDKTKVDEFYEKYKNLTLSDSDVNVLYKRKFDNVQEYLERKKVRLESGK